MVAARIVFLSLLFAFSGADLITEPLACSGAENATQCLLGQPATKWDAGAAEEKQAAQEAKEKEEKMAASRIFNELMEQLLNKLKLNAGSIFLWILLACIVAVAAAVMGGQLRQTLFGCGPITVSTKDRAECRPEEGEHPPSDALLIDDEGRVLAARAAELSVPLDHALVLTTMQREGIRRARFVYQQEGKTEHVSVSSDVVGRMWEAGKLTLQLASGRKLCIEDSGAFLLSADKTKQFSVPEGALTIPQFHMRDMGEIKRKVQNSRLGQAQDSHSEVELSQVEL